MIFARITKTAGICEFPAKNSLSSACTKISDFGRTAIFARIAKTARNAQSCEKKTANFERIMKNAGICSFFQKKILAARQE